MTTTDNEVITTLCRRVTYLRWLGGEKRSRRELARELDLSESTVYKHVRELENQGFVTQAADGYRLTLFGQVLFQYYQKLEGLAEFQDLLSDLPPTVQIKPSVFEDAHVMLGERHAPHEPVDYLVETTTSSDQLRGFSPVFLRAYGDLFERLIERRTDTVFLFDEDVLNHLATRHSDQFDVMCASPAISLLAITDPLPFGLFLFDNDLMFLVFHGENGDIVGVAYNGTDRSVDWGIHLFRKYRGQARKYRLKGQETDEQVGLTSRTRQKKK